MTEYIMRKLKFIRDTKVDIPASSFGFKIDRDPLSDDYVLMFLEPVV